jgi:hypothetical protein
MPQIAAPFRYGLVAFLLSIKVLDPPGWLIQVVLMQGQLGRLTLCIDLKVT